MKNIMHSGKIVDDVAGLYYELIKNDFLVENVGVDKKGTHVFLSDLEQKDPAPIVDSWIGKTVPVPTRSMVEQRKALTSEYLAKKAQKEAAARIAEAAEAGEAPVSVAAAPLPALAGSKQTLFSKIFRKLW